MSNVINLTKLKYCMGTDDIDYLYYLKQREIPHGAGIVIIKLPKEISVLQNLEVFGARYQTHNFHIPMEIGKLGNLKELYFEDSVIRTLPTTIGDLHKLERLRCTRCKITHIPSEIGRLNNLEELRLYHNEIPTIPTELGNCIKLRTLDLSYNNISTIPTELANLCNLLFLHLNVNNLHDNITVDTSQMAKLVELRI